jgi:hypothetical protein
MKETTTHLSDYVTYDGVEYEYHATDHGDRRGMEIDSIDPQPDGNCIGLFDKVVEMAIEHAENKMHGLPEPVVIFKGVLPEICGYGIEAYGQSVDEVIELMRKAFAEWKTAYELGHEWAESLETACEYFGGRIEKLVLPCAGDDGGCGETVWPCD